MLTKCFFSVVPFGGTPYAFKTLHEGEYLGPFVSASQWTTFTMPSIYEMLPLDTTALFADEHSQGISIDHFNVENWINYGMGIFSDSEWDQFEKNATCISLNQERNYPV